MRRLSFDGRIGLYLVIGLVCIAIAQGGGAPVFWVFGILFAASGLLRLAGPNWAIWDDEHEKDEQARVSEQRANEMLKGKGYKCPVCSERFESKDKGIKHLRKHHPDALAEDTAR